MQKNLNFGYFFRSLAFEKMDERLTLKNSMLPVAKIPPTRKLTAAFSPQNTHRVTVLFLLHFLFFNQPRPRYLPTKIYLEPV